MYTTGLWLTASSALLWAIWPRRTQSLLDSARVSVHFADIIDRSDNDDSFEIGA